MRGCRWITCHPDLPTVSLLNRPITRLGGPALARPEPPTGVTRDDRQRIRWGSVTGIFYIAWLIVTMGLAASGLAGGRADFGTAIAIPPILLLALAVWSVRSLLVRIVGTTIGALIALAKAGVLIKATSPAHANEPSVIGGLVIAGVLLITYTCATLWLAWQIRLARRSQR